MDDEFKPPMATLSDVEDPNFTDSRKISQARFFVNISLIIFLISIILTYQLPENLRMATAVPFTLLLVVSSAWLNYRTLNIWLAMITLISIIFPLTFLGFLIYGYTNSSSTLEIYGYKSDFFGRLKKV